MTNPKVRRIVLRNIALALGASVAQTNAIAQTMPRVSKFRASAELLRLCAVIYPDFAKQLETRSGQQTSDLEKHLSTLENYEFEITQSGDRYTVAIRPRQTKEHQIRGGGTTYQVNRQTFEIIKKTQSR